MGCHPGGHCSTMAVLPDSLAGAPDLALLFTGVHFLRPRNVGRTVSLPVPRSMGRTVSGDSRLGSIPGSAASCCRTVAKPTLSTRERGLCSQAGCSR